MTHTQPLPYLIRRAILPAALVVQCILPIQAYTQTAETEGLKSYSRAREVLEQSIQAVGGLDALRSIQNVRREMAGDWLDTGQAPRPWTDSSGKMPPSHEHDDVLSVIDYKGNRWMEYVKFSYHEGDAEYVRQTDVVTEEQGYEGISYVKEKPFLQTFSREDLPALRYRKFRRYPEGFLLMALDRPETLQWVGSSTESDRREDVISFTDPAGARVLLYMDSKTHLPARSELLRQHPVAGDTASEIVYSDYRQVGKLQLPFRYVDRVASVPTQDWHANSIVLNTAVHEEDFQAPKEFARIEEDPEQLELQPLGQDLYLIRGAYNVVFLVQKEEVLVFEAPLNSGYSEECLKIIRKAAPGKSIRLVSTHFHHDHIGGVRAYIAEGIPILTTEDARGEIERASRSRLTMHPDALSVSPHVPVIEVISGSKIFDDGEHRAEVYDFGPIDHVDQMLVAYFPHQKLLFEADMWDVPSKDLYVGGSDMAHMLKKIRELGLQVERIVPVHGAPSTMDNLNQALAVRARYIPQTP